MSYCKRSETLVYVDGYGGVLARLAALRSECRRYLRGIAIPEPFDLSAFCAAIARTRGRPLHLHPLPCLAEAGSPCGVWLATDSADHIFHAAGSSELHRQHIVLHEIGHMLCAHELRDPEIAHLTGSLLPDLRAGMVARVLTRSGYDAYQEQMAEMIASEILGRRAAGAAVLAPETPVALANLADMLGLLDRRSGGGQRD